MTVSMKTFAAVLLLAAAPVPGQAKEFPIPAAHPIATLTAPESWVPETYPAGLDLTSPDARIFIAAEAVKADSLTDAVAATAKTLVSQGLAVDARDMTINGLRAQSFAYTRQDKSGAQNFTVTLVQTSRPGAFVMLTYWGSPAAEQANSEALTAIAQSLQPTR